MDGNFRAMGRHKDGGALHSPLHRGEMFFRDEEAFREYLNRVAEETEVREYRLVG